MTFTAQAMSALNLETPLVSLLELPTATLRVWAFGMRRLEQGINRSPLRFFWFVGEVSGLRRLGAPSCQNRFVKCIVAECSNGNMDASEPVQSSRSP